jgi:hypothetical protein
LLCGLLIHAAEPLHERGLPHQAAGRLLRRLAGPEGVVLADSAWVRHYAGDAGRLRRRRLTVADLRRALEATERPHVYLALTVAGRQRDPEMARLLRSPAFDLIAWPISPAKSDDGLRLYRVTIDKLPSGE